MHRIVPDEQLEKPTQFVDMDYEGSYPINIYHSAHANESQLLAGTL